LRQCDILLLDKYNVEGDAGLLLWKIDFCIVLPYYEENISFIVQSMRIEIVYIYRFLCCIWN